MQTKEQIEQAFRAELQALLDKYGAELEAKDHYCGYPECGEDVRMTVGIPGIWDKDGEPVREFTEIDLGACLFPTPSGQGKPAYWMPLPETPFAKAEDEFNEEQAKNGGMPYGTYGGFD